MTVSSGYMYHMVFCSSCFCDTFKKNPASVFCLHDRCTIDNCICSFVQEYLLVENNDSIRKPPAKSFFQTWWLNIGCRTILTNFHIGCVVSEGDLLVKCVSALINGNGQISIGICFHLHIGEIIDSATVIFRFFIMKPAYDSYKFLWHSVYYNSCAIWKKISVILRCLRYKVCIWNKRDVFAHIYEHSVICQPEICIVAVCIFELYFPEGFALCARQCHKVHCCSRNRNEVIICWVRFSCANHLRCLNTYINSAVLTSDDLFEIEGCFFSDAFLCIIHLLLGHPLSYQSKTEIDISVGFYFYFIRACRFCRCHARDSRITADIKDIGTERILNTISDFSCSADIQLVGCYKCLSGSLKCSAIHLDGKNAFTQICFYRTFSIRIRRAVCKCNIAFSFCPNDKIWCVFADLITEAVISFCWCIDIRCKSIGIWHLNVFQNQVFVSVVCNLYIWKIGICNDCSFAGNITDTCFQSETSHIIVIKFLNSNCISIRFQELIRLFQTVCKVIIKSCICDQSVKNIYKHSCCTTAYMNSSVKDDISCIFEFTGFFCFCIRIKNNFYKFVNPFNNFFHNLFDQFSDQRDLTDLIYDLCYNCLYLGPFIIDHGICNCCCAAADNLCGKFRSVCSYGNILSGKFCVGSYIYIYIITSGHCWCCIYVSGKSNYFCIRFTSDILSYYKCLNIQIFCSADPCIINSRWNIVVYIWSCISLCFGTCRCSIGFCFCQDHLILNISTNCGHFTEDSGFCPVFADVCNYCHIAVNVCFTLVGTCRCCCFSVSIRIKIGICNGFDIKCSISGINVSTVSYSCSYCGIVIDLCFRSAACIHRSGRTGCNAFNVACFVFFCEKFNISDHRGNIYIITYYKRCFSCYIVFTFYRTVSSSAIGRILYLCLCICFCNSLRLNVTPGFQHCTVTDLYRWILAFHSIFCSGCSTCNQSRTKQFHIWGFSDLICCKNKNIICGFCFAKDCCPGICLSGNSFYKKYTKLQCSDALCFRNLCRNCQIWLCRDFQTVHCIFVFSYSVGIYFWISANICFCYFAVCAFGCCSCNNHCISVYKADRHSRNCSCCCYFCCSICKDINLKCSDNACACHISFYAVIRISVNIYNVHFCQWKAEVRSKCLCICLWWGICTDGSFSSCCFKNSIIHISDIYGFCLCSCWRCFSVNTGNTDTFFCAVSTDHAQCIYIQYWFYSNASVFGNNSCITGWIFTCAFDISFLFCFYFGSYNIDCHCHFADLNHSSIDSCTGVCVSRYFYVYIAFCRNIQFSADVSVCFCTCFCDCNIYTGFIVSYCDSAWCRYKFYFGISLPCISNIYITVCTDSSVST